MKRAHSLAQRELGVAINLLGYRFYKTEEWQGKLEEFLPGDHYSIHKVQMEQDHKDREPRRGAANEESGKG